MQKGIEDIEMNDCDEADELGRNVTPLAKPDGQPGKAIVSVNLGYDDIAWLEKIGGADGKTVAQVIRDAIAAYRVEKPAAPVQR